jgi:transposase
MRFVEIKSCEQIDLQALHRVRDRIVGNRTQLICQMRAFCLEYGIAIRPGTGAFKLDIARIITDETNDLTPAIRALLKELWEELQSVDIRYAVVSRQVEALAAKDDTARRLMTIPGFAGWCDCVIAAVGDARQFRKARVAVGVRLTCAQSWRGLREPSLDSGNNSAWARIKQFGARRNDLPQKAFAVGCTCAPCHRD